MPSGAMICMTTDGLKYLAPFCQNAFFEKFSSRAVAFKDMDIFHLTLHSLRIELQINILKLYGVLKFFLRPRGKIPHFLVPDV